MEQYVFRVLNTQDVQTLPNKGIESKLSLSNDKKIKDVLSMVLGHLQYGSDAHYHTPWISTTSNFYHAVANYNLARFNFDCKRMPIAVIKNHFQSTVDIHNTDTSNINNIPTIYDKPITEINKLVFNLSTALRAKILCHLNLILKKDYSPAYGSGMAINYATHASEILTYRRIENQDIITTLTPLESDLLYTCQNQPNGGQFQTLLSDMISKTFIPTNYISLLSGSRKKLYEDLYIQNKHLHEVAFAVYQQNPQYDILLIYAALINLKRDLLKELVSIHHNTSGFFIPEEELAAIHIGNEGMNTNATINYAGNPLEIRKMLSPIESQFDTLNKVAFIVNTTPDLQQFDQNNITWFFPHIPNYFVKPQSNSQNLRRMRCHTQSLTK